MHCRSSHMPFTFLRKQIFPPTPPRFVKFKDRASSLTHGESKTVPTNDQVPELINAQSSPAAGIAATADAVSWQAGTIACVSRNAGRSANLPERGPSTEPLGTITGAAEISKPNSRKISPHQR